jgi:hypothetical protein
MARNTVRGVMSDVWFNAPHEISTTSWSHSPAPSFHLVTVPVAGRYQINAKVVFSPNTTGLRSAFILVNGTILEGNTVNATSSGNAYVYVEALTDNLPVGAKISVQSLHTSNVTVAVSPGGTVGVDYNRLNIRKV